MNRLEGFSFGALTQNTGDASKLFFQFSLVTQSESLLRSSLQRAWQRENLEGDGVCWLSINRGDREVRAQFSDALGSQIGPAGSEQGAIDRRRVETGRRPHLDPNDDVGVPPAPARGLRPHHRPPTRQARDSKAVFPRLQVMGFASP